MRNLTRIAAGTSLAALMVGLAVFNVQAWLAEGFVILAAIAACSEAIGFLMAVMVELAMRSQRYLAAGVCFVILIVCAGFNVIGAERAWDASMVRHLETSRLHAQATLDATRAEQRQKLADAQERIREYDPLLPDADTLRARQAGMQAAWDRATFSARADAEKAQRELDRLPVVAEVTAPFRAWQVALGFGLAELIKALGLWACGFGSVSERQRSKRNEDVPEATVIPFDSLERVRAMRNAGASYGRIYRETGIAKSTAWRACN